MNSVLFSFKRIFHKSIQFGKVLLQDFGLTPARFDMLHVIFQQKGGTIRQKRLCEILGVTRATVSRMLQSLQALGLVVRQRVLSGDRRQLDVTLTADGRTSISAAMIAMFEDDFCEYETKKRVFTFKRPGTLEVVVATWQRLDLELSRIRSNYGDHSAMHYLWSYEHRGAALAWMAR